MLENGQDSRDGCVYHYAMVVRTDLTGQLRSPCLCLRGRVLGAHVARDEDRVAQLLWVRRHVLAVTDDLSDVREHLSV